MMAATASCGNFMKCLALPLFSRPSLAARAAVRTKKLNAMGSRPPSARQLALVRRSKSIRDRRPWNRTGGPLGILGSLGSEAFGQLHLLELLLLQNEAELSNEAREGESAVGIDAVHVLVYESFPQEEPKYGGTPARPTYKLQL